MAVARYWSVVKGSGRYSLLDEELVWETGTSRWYVARREIHGP
jgi:hypothetical protein